MRRIVVTAASAFLVYLVILVGGSALLPDGTFQDWGWPAICAAVAAIFWVWLDRRRERRVLSDEAQQYLHEHTD